MTNGVAGATSKLRVLFVNTGIMGHRTVAHAIRESMKHDPCIESTEVDLSEGLNLSERLVRRVLTVGARPGSMMGGLTYARFRHELDAGLRARRRIDALEKTRRFDVVHFHTQAAAWASLDRMKKVPTIVSIDATQGLLGLMQPRGALRWDYSAPAARDRRVFKAAAAIVSTSEWAVSHLKAEQPDCENKIHVIPYPVSLSGFGSDWAGQRRRPRTGKKVEVLFIGGSFAFKGGFDLLSAWQRSRAAERANLTIATSDPSISEDALPRGVRLLRGIQARSEQWLSLWHDADIFAFPTKMDAFGIVLQEAAAAGLPVIGTNLNAVPEIVEHDQTGLLVNPGDVDGIARALTALIDSPDLRHRLGSAARKRVETLGSMERYGEQLSGVIQEVARVG